MNSMKIIRSRRRSKRNNQRLSAHYEMKFTVTKTALITGITGQDRSYLAEAVVELLLIAGLSGLAVWLELAQFLSPGREPDLVQVAGSLIGILLGLILARLWRMDRRST